MLLSKLEAGGKQKGGAKSETSGHNQGGNYVSKCGNYGVLFLVFSDVCMCVCFFKNTIKRWVSANSGH